MSVSEPPFSVIIPTLQRSKELIQLVDLCVASPRVRDVVVVNNARAPLTWASRKVTVLQQEQNIFVNPAWNLGVTSTRGRLLAVLNDDILFDPALFDFIEQSFAKRPIGLLGVGSSCYSTKGKGKPRLARSYFLNHGFGTAMFLERENWVPIPSDLLIYHGDQWLFTRQTRPNYSIEGFPIETQMSVTSGAAEFSGRLEADAATYRAHGGDAGYYHRTRWQRRATQLFRSPLRLFESRG